MCVLRVMSVFVVGTFFLNCVDASKHSTSVNVRDQKVDKANQQRLAKQVALLRRKKFRLSDLKVCTSEDFVLK